MVGSQALIDQVLGWMSRDGYSPSCRESTLLSAAYQSLGVTQAGVGVELHFKPDERVPVYRHSHHMPMSRLVNIGR